MVSKKKEGSVKYLSFFVNTVYTLFDDFGVLPPLGPWRKLWKLSVPLRARTFLWLCVRRMVMTNTFRAIRSLIGGFACSLCGSVAEDIYN